MFENSWSVDDSWLDAMSHVALIQIHEFQGNPAKASEHSEMLERLGGIEIVEDAWIEKIESCLRRLSQPISESE